MRQNSTILIVEDVGDVRKLVRIALDNGRREIRDAVTALEGLHCARESPPDILLLDIGLPGVFNGFSLCESLRKDPQHIHLRVVVISGHGEVEDLEQARRLGVAAYVVKPFSPTALATLVAQLEDQMRETMTIVR